MNDYYDVAQICLNGHVINSMARSHPLSNKIFCSKCGEATVTSCQHCNADIKGFYHMARVANLLPYHGPNFCDNCGAAYPWTERTVIAAKELVDEQDKLSVKEKELLKESIDDMVRNTPKTETAIMRFKKLVVKAGGEAPDLFKDLLINVVSQAIIHQIGWK